MAKFQVYDTYEEEILYLKSWISQRLSWMDSQILQLELDKHNSFINYAVHHAYPNPYNSTINIKYDLQSHLTLKYQSMTFLVEKLKFY